MVLKQEKPDDPTGLILQSWSQGFLIGSLIMMAAITVSNMRRGVLLHKLIFVEVRVLAVDRYEHRMTTTS